MILGTLAFIILLQINYFKTKVIIYGDTKASAFLLLLYPVLIGVCWAGVVSNAFDFTVAFIVSVYVFLIFMVFKKKREV